MAKSMRITRATTKHKRDQSANLPQAEINQLMHRRVNPQQCRKKDKNVKQPYQTEQLQGQQSQSKQGSSPPPAKDSASYHRLPFNLTTKSYQKPPRMEATGTDKVPTVSQAGISARIVKHMASSQVCV